MKIKIKLVFVCNPSTHSSMKSKFTSTRRTFKYSHQSNISLCPTNKIRFLMFVSKIIKTAHSTIWTLKIASIRNILVLRNIRNYIYYSFAHIPLFCLIVSITYAPLIVLDFSSFIRLFAISTYSLLMSNPI